ncbi:MAG: signal peptide peptidase SppA [Brevinematia bacterium]
MFMSDRLKNFVIWGIFVLLLVNIVLGIVLVSINVKRAKVLSTGISSLIGNVGLIKVNGIIANQEEDYFSYAYANAERIANQIKTFADTPTIKAIRIDVSSPGGTVSGAETIVSAIRYAKEKGKKVVVFMKEIATSGGYYVSALADHIVASRGTLTGSIGVIVQGINMKGLFEKLGLKVYTFKSGELKDILSPYRDVSDKEKQLLKNIVDSYYQRFLEIILEGRSNKIKKEELLKIADGRILTEVDALKSNLIDSIGTEFEVENILKDLTGERTITYVSLPERRSIINELLRSFFGFNFSYKNLFPKILYLGY